MKRYNFRCHVNGTLYASDPSWNSAIFQCSSSCLKLTSPKNSNTRREKDNSVPDCIGQHRRWNDGRERTPSSWWRSSRRRWLFEGASAWWCWRLPSCSIENLSFKPWSPKYVRLVYLEMNTEVGTPGLAGLGRVFRFTRIFAHFLCWDETKLVSIER